SYSVSVSDERFVAPLAPKLGASGSGQGDTPLIMCEEAWHDLLH
ncbi:hypothetical protein RRG08_056491, partial [Elysia crispata]